MHKQSFFKSPETKWPPRDKSVFGWSSSHCSCSRVTCSAGVFFERVICSRKRDVETFRREEEMGRVKRERGGGGEREEKSIFFLPYPSPLSFFRPGAYRKGYYFYSPQSSTVIKSKTAATTILRTRTRFRPPKIRLHCRLALV